MDVKIRKRGKMRTAIQAMEIRCDECGKKELREKWVPYDQIIPGWAMSSDASDFCSDVCMRIDQKRLVLMCSITNWEEK